MDVSGRKEENFTLWYKYKEKFLFALNLVCKWIANKDNFFLIWSYFNAVYD